MTYDVVCLGAGGAGITVAAGAAGQGLSVALISKEPTGYGNTRMSGGSIAFPGLSDGDGEEVFYQDLIRGGENLNQEALAKVMAAQGNQGALILEELGHALNRDEEGEVSEKVLSKWGGHSRARTIASPGKMGGLIGQALRSALARSSAEVFEETVACRLLVENDRVMGVVCLDLVSGEVFPILAKAVVLATGGAGWLYFPRTSNFRTICGDGLALAFAAGAEMIDMEMVQFLPFSFTHPPCVQGIGVGDPMAAGPYGKLINKDGQVVLDNIHVKTRAQVAKAIALEIAKGKGTEHGGLILDHRGNLGKEDGMAAREPWESMGLFDPVREIHGEAAFAWEEPWDVAPTAHFMMGGVRADSFGRTSLEGLFAAGEVMGGLHGANRLGSVALAEIFVFSRRTAGEIAKYCRDQAPPQASPSLLEAEAGRIKSLFGQRGDVRPITLKKAVQELMWDTAGPVRHARNITSGLARLEELEPMLADLTIAPFSEYNLEVLDAIEADFMLNTARMIMLCSKIRQESRGAHTRLDFPEKDDQHWLGNIMLQKDGDQIAWRFVPKAGTSATRER